MDGNVKDCFLIVEKKVLSKCSARLAPLALLGAFYAFNMHYTEGCANFYTLLEEKKLTRGHQVENQGQLSAAF